MAFKMNLGHRTGFQPQSVNPFTKQSVIRNTLNCVPPGTPPAANPDNLPECGKRVQKGDAYAEGDATTREEVIDGQRFLVTDQNMRKDFVTVNKNEGEQGDAGAFVVRNGNKLPNDEWVSQLKNQICTPEGKAANPDRYAKLCVGEFDLAPTPDAYVNIDENETYVDTTRELIPDPDPDPIPPSPPGMSFGTTGAKEGGRNKVSLKLPPVDLSGINPFNIVKTMGNVVFTKAGKCKAGCATNKPK